MCGRYTLGADAEELVEAFDVPVLGFAHAPRYNVAPGQLAPVVAEDARGRRIGLLEWGLIPAWKATPGAPIINARVETALEKPSFREACARRRCLVPADGFYEWARVGAEKVPHWIHQRDGSLMSFGGIWERWVRDGSAARFTFAILTTSANDDVRPVHPRMPLVVPPEARGAWLDRAAPPSRVVELLAASVPPGLTHHVVGRRVNRPTEEGADLIDPARPD